MERRNNGGDRRTSQGVFVLSHADKDKVASDATIAHVFPAKKKTHWVVQVRHVSCPDPGVRLGGHDGLGPYRLPRVILNPS